MKLLLKSIKTCKSDDLKQIAIFIFYISNYLPIAVTHDKSDSGQSSLGASTTGPTAHSWVTFDQHE